MITTEVWKPIEENNEYFVSNYGRVRHGDRILRLIMDRYGYPIVSISHPKKLLKVHRLVGKAFIPNPEGKPQINHIDYDRSNNHADNLEWVTPKENTAHSICNFPKFKKMRSPTGEKYVILNKNSGSYRVKFRKQYYGSYKTIEEAKAVRDKVVVDYEEANAPRE